MKANASLEFTNFKVLQKPSFGTHVANCLNTNASLFPDLPVTIEVLTRQNTEFANAIAGTESGDKTAKALVKQINIEWNNNYRLLARYVSTVANGNALTINKGGFNPTKTGRQPKPLPGDCRGFEAIAPKAQGTINLDCKADRAAKGYMYIGVPDGINVEQQGNQLAITVNGVTAYLTVTTRTKGQLLSAPSGKQLHISALAFNAAGAGPLTNGQVVIPQ